MKIHEIMWRSVAPIADTAGTTRYQQLGIVSPEFYCLIWTYASEFVVDRTVIRGYSFSQLVPSCVYFVGRNTPVYRA